MLYSVSQLNAHIRQVLESQVVAFWVTGELSNVVYASSGHVYLTLKDPDSQIRCIVWKYVAVTLAQKLKNGDLVEVYGQLTVYEPHGTYQIIVKVIQPSGMGQLYIRLEALKKKLSEEGLFSVAKKRPLPPIPNHIGIITSLKAAALQDVLITLQKRRPDVSVIIYPCQVQGADAAPSIVYALHIANQRREVDVLLVCRGGGSIEDLWSFNEEIVVRAIAESHIPTVCGIGHESDTTLADLAADMRAATPTAAIECATPRRTELWLTVQKNYARLLQCVRRQFFTKQQHFDLLRPRLINPATRIAMTYRQLLHQAWRLFYATHTLLDSRCAQAQHVLLRFRAQCAQLSTFGEPVRHLQFRLGHSMQAYLEKFRLLTEQKKMRLSALDPSSILDRGYALVLCNDSLVTAEHTAQIGDRIVTCFSWGDITSTVENVERGQKNLRLPTTQIGVE